MMSAPNTRERGFHSQSVCFLRKFGVYVVVP
jgi:hypothetical protein